MDYSRSIFSKKELSIDDLYYMRKLLETNMPLNYCMDLLENSKNRDSFTKIREKLSGGKLIEEIISEYLPTSIKEYMLPLLGHFSFAESLSLSLDFYEKNSGGLSTFIGQIAYPCVLLFVTVSALYLFDLYGLDSIFGLLKSFTSDLGIYQDLRIMFRIFIRIFYYGMLGMIVIIVYFISPKRISFLYIVVSRYFPDSLLNIYYSEEFVSLLLICVSKGYGSRQSLDILKRMKHKPIISLLAFHLDESLLEGESLQAAVKKKYYDMSLSRFIRIASSSDDFEGILGSYTSMAQERIRRRMKRASGTIQVFNYTIIGLIIIFIYQVLFMPMQAISAY
ncbi:MAG: type II secretion system F family protein [Erysipelotrichaceae bacterium]|nr:type II secretion system F family protein [Erysipelotrichaceae bacterium]